MQVLSLGLLFGIAAATNAPSLCSSELTAQGDGTYEQFNSFGKCTGLCSGYAFAIALGTTCWCSNEAPGSTVDTSQCGDSCPGFPSDECGNEQDNLYAYFKIGQPSGTAKASSSSSSSSSSTSSSSTSSSQASSSTSSSTSSSISTSSSSTSMSSSSTTSSTTSFSSSSSSSTSSTISSASSSATTTGAPSISYVTVTESNSVETQTITQNASGTGAAEAARSSSTLAAVSSETSANKESHGFWHNHGAVAGVFVVVGLVVLAALLALLWLCCRRRRDHGLVMAHSPHGSGVPPSHRTSFAALENDSQLVPIFDQRVNAQQMYMRWENNHSAQSLQDNEDYSRRVLRVANPE